ncbi:FMN-binding protein [Neorhodopirellula pilleata]|uniref:Electron transport complex subunit RsxG n=1 Tax=Neorhodopirellula pilleata TaxID=2714738 RepID=A0A5C6A0J7_9BACT|nr:FMN-binding protein [Neorhodopirellula pilleata]TWT93089.1 Electron transport complex subunit RsxG [Neorhodopirellula pilleata]
MSIPPTYRTWLVHAIRCSILAGLLLLLPSPHGRSLGERLAFGNLTIDDEAAVSPPTLEQVIAATGGAFEVARVEPTANDRGLFELQDQAGNRIGWAARTLPAAQDVAGYRGPTEAVLILDQQQAIVAVDVLGSHDTEEHVDEVRNSPAFLNQFVGLTWGGRSIDDSSVNIDGVSGATLTSLAMARGILKRLGSETRSLVFDRPLSLEDAQKVFPDAQGVSGDPVATVVADVDDPESVLGTLVRTGAFVENEVGYQGPTEMLLGFDGDGKLLKPVVRQSFDNEPYVGYVPQEYSFWQFFRGKTITELAAFNVQAEGVEGVSGATMTSMAIAYTLPQVAAKIEATGGLKQWTAPSPPPGRWDRIEQAISQIRWTLADGITIGLIMLLAVLVGTHQMRRKPIRTAWLILVIIGIGGWTGNLISLALIAGWTTSGVSWYLAIGLVGLVAVAMVIPPTRRGNPYCNHLCPHGAIQQLIRPGATSKRKRNLPRGWHARLANLPAVTLAVAYVLLLFRPQTDVSVLEPFHAYLWTIASWSAIVFAVATLLFSATIPMGYCRLGCPTGRLIEHIRLKTSSNRWSRFDWAASGLLLIALVSFLARRSIV